MTKLEALVQLRDKVKAGGNDAWHGCGDVFGVIDAMDFVSAFNGSLDAAKALHEAVLPGWAWTVGDNEAVVYGPNEWIGEQDHFVAVVSDSNPARAWLLTILGALIAQEE